MASGFLGLHTTTGALIGLLALLSVFSLARGHHAPGGGFVGGLLLAAAIALQLLTHGPAHARSVLRVEPRTLIATGLGLAVLAGWLGLLTGRPLLAPLVAGEVPGLGHVGTVMMFDLGVYALVAGAALAILFSLVEAD